MGTISAGLARASRRPAPGSSGGRSHATHTPHARPQPPGIAEGEHHRPRLSREQPIQRVREGFNRPADEPAPNRRVSSLAKLALYPGPIAVTTADQAETARIRDRHRQPAAGNEGHRGRKDRVSQTEPAGQSRLHGHGECQSTLPSPGRRITGALSRNPGYADRASGVPGPTTEGARVTDGIQSKVTYPAPAAIAARHKLSEGTGGRPARIDEVIDTVIILTDKLQDAHPLAKSARPSELQLSLVRTGCPCDTEAGLAG
jgi:hypothetical protein